LKIVVIAGPQSSGKTTSLKYLREKYADQLDFHPEINQNTLFPEAKMGSVAVTPEMEREIVQTDINHLDNLPPSDLLQLAETAPFHLVYSHHLDPDYYQEAILGYKQALEKHELYIIFIDTKPKVSFARRKRTYLARVKKAIKEQNLSPEEASSYTRSMMLKYERAITERYPIWKNVLSEINYAKGKIIIPNNHSNQDKFLAEIEAAFLTIL